MVIKLALFLKKCQEVWVRYPLIDINSTICKIGKPRARGTPKRLKRGLTLALLPLYNSSYCHYATTETGKTGFL
jgi:hypothetical protein